MESILHCAIQAAREAGEHIADAARRLETIAVEQKSAHDYVSEVDRKSEQLIREAVRSAFPEHGFLGEEYGESDQSAQAEYQWIVDPLDGTTNFLRAIPHYAVSIAVQREGVTQIGVVFDVAKQELFSATLGEGAFLNDQPLKVEDKSDYAGALLATGVPFSGRNLAELDAFTKTMEELLSLGSSGIRRLGSAALDLAYVAAGRYDGYWEAMLKPWDIAAGALLVKESGKSVTDFDGKGDYLLTGDIVAGPEVVHQKLVAATREHYCR